MLGFGKKESAAKLPAQFTIPIERKKADGSPLTFDIKVSGFFEGAGGKPSFTVTAISANGIPNIDMKGFSPAELSQIEKYAVDIHYKKMLGMK
jgi:hypothetical protein